MKGVLWPVEAPSNGYALGRHTKGIRQRLALVDPLRITLRAPTIRPRASLIQRPFTFHFSPLTTAATLDLMEQL